MAEIDDETRATVMKAMRYDPAPKTRCCSTCKYVHCHDFDDGKYACHMNPVVTFNVRGNGVCKFFKPQVTEVK